MILAPPMLERGAMADSDRLPAGYAVCGRDHDIATAPPNVHACRIVCSAVQLLACRHVGFEPCILPDGMDHRAHVHGHRKHVSMESSAANRIRPAVLRAYFHQ